ncbi:MAG: hypothetical protein G01um101431_984 [Parcubacteria group bacterium Gr01-1014_31]|nr:MAG: hypothetical protein G01um101431_984 [Parcubacteria group bacterium Gr01-1014_31]
MYQPGNNPLLVSIANIATSKDLYTFEEKDTGQKTRVMEGVFAEHEGAVAAVLAEIIRIGNLPATERERSDIAAFVSLLRVRGPSFNEWLKNMDIGHIKLLQKIQTEHPDSLREKFKQAGVSFSSNEEFEEMRKFMQDPNKYSITMEGGEGHYFKQAMDLSKEIYEILMSKKSWHLLIAPHNRHFITSDNPVVTQEPAFCPPHIAGGVLNGTVLLTISPKYCLSFRRIPLNSHNLLLTRDDVNHINRSIASAARRQLYGHLNSKDWAILCNEYLTGDESKVIIEKLAPFAPYYMLQGTVQLKEADALKNNSVTPTHVPQS